MIVITVPHAACPHVESDACDSNAEEIAEEISKKTPSARVIVSKVHRDPRFLAFDGLPGSDQNRSPGRITEFKRDFLDALGDASLVLDVHSFPRETAFDDVYILDPSSAWDTSAKSLAKRLGVPSYEGSRENWIVVRAREEGIPSILVEFSRELSSERIDFYSSEIADWAEDFLRTRFV